MAKLPPFPTQSLYGSFPKFPTYKFGYGTSILGHNIGFSVNLPNLAQIGTYVEEIGQWIIGWIAAIFEWCFEWLSIEFLNTGNWLINEWTRTILTLTYWAEKISEASGIAEPLIFALLGGLLLMSIIIIIILIINTAKVLI